MLKEATISQFGLTLRLSALKYSEGQVTFVIHGRSCIHYSSGPSVYEMLARLGYQQCNGRCPINEGGECYWLPLASLNGHDHWAVERIHASFDKHVSDLPGIMNAMQQIFRSLGSERGRKLDLFPELRRADIPVVTPVGGGLPSWAAAAMPAEFKELERAIKEGQENYRRLLSVGALLTSTGADLEAAVSAAFGDLGFNPQASEPGASYDLAVELEGNIKLFIEVTGIDGPLRKNSNKISQALDVFQNIKGENDRIVIAANCHRDIELAARGVHEIVTPDALRVLTPIGVIILPTPVLFEIWRQSKGDLASSKQFINELATRPAGIATL